jgi:hypothetical protein
MTYTIPVLIVAYKKIYLKTSKFSIPILTSFSNFDIALKMYIDIKLIIEIVRGTVN